MLIGDDWQHFLRKIERWSKDHDEKVGARKQMLRRVREQFKCKSLKEAEDLYESIRKQLLKISKVYAAKRKRFDRKYKAKLKEYRD